MSTANLNAAHLDFIETAGEGLKAAEFIANAAEAQQVKLAAKAPDLAKQAVALGLVDSTDQEKFAALLQDPVECQNVLGRLLKMRAKEAAENATKQASALGQPANDTSSESHSESPFVGARGGKEKKASDRALLKLAGL